MHHSSTPSCYIYDLSGSRQDSKTGYKGKDTSSRKTGYSKGEKIIVEWKNKWYKAIVLKKRRNRYYIHYEGWDSKWDEWVTADRMKSR